MVAERYKLMTPDRRMRIASSMFETARAIIESSLPLNLTRRERRLAFAKRLHAGTHATSMMLLKWRNRTRVNRNRRSAAGGADRPNPPVGTLK